MSTIYSRVGGVGSAPSSRLTAGYLHTCSVKERRAGGGSEVECMELKLHFTAVGPSRPLILFKEVLSFNLSWTDEAGSSDLTGGSWIHGRRVWDLLSDITSASRLTCWGWDALKSHSSSRRWRESLRLAERVPETMRLTVLETTLISCRISTRRNSESVFWFCVIKQFHQFKSFLLLLSFLLWCRQKHQNHQRFSDLGSDPDWWSLSAYHQSTCLCPFVFHQENTSDSSHWPFWTFQLVEKLEIRLLKKLQTINIDHEKTCNHLQFPRCIHRCEGLCTDLILRHHVISSGTLQLAATCTQRIY